jgi:DNA polymerase-3 subunit beta
VVFTRGERHLFFNYGRRLLVSRTIDGEFPKYQKIIPRANTNVLTVDRGALMSAVRRVGLVSESLVMSWSAGTLDLSSRSAEVGDADERLSVSYDGAELKLMINWKYLLDFLEHASESVITIAARNDTSPLLLTDGADFINVVMVQK